MSDSLKTKSNTMAKSKFVKVISSYNFGENKTFMMEINSDISSLKKEISDRCGSGFKEIYWKDEEGERIDIKVDGDLIAFLAKGNGKIFVKDPPIRTQDDFALEQEYDEFVRENRFY